MAVVMTSKMGMVNAMKNYDGFSIIGIKAVTIPKLNKFDRDMRTEEQKEADKKAGIVHVPKTIQEKFGIDPANIRKFAHLTVGAGYDYETSVINQLIKEGKDPSEYERGTSWHKPYIDPETGKASKCIVTHPETGELYFYVQNNTANPSKYHYEDISTGRIIDEADLRPYFPPDKKPKNQGTDKPIQPLCYKLESVKEISAFGNQYILG